MKNTGQFKKGQSAWNKGKKMSQSMRNKMREIAKARRGTLSPRWQLKPTYNAVHLWMKKNFGNPFSCEDCGILGKRNGSKWSIHWSNLTGRYLRDRNDWIGRCAKCHATIDGQWRRRKRNSRGQFK